MASRYSRPKGIGVIQERSWKEAEAKAWNDGKEGYVPPLVEDLGS